MKNIIFIAAIFLVSCNKQREDFKVNKFEVSFASYGADKISKYILFASTDGKRFVPVKEIAPSPNTNNEYRVQFAIPRDQLNADGTVLFYLEETASSGSVSRTEILTVQ
jgi:hypothetical protein